MSVVLRKNTLTARTYGVRYDQIHRNRSGCWDALWALGAWYLTAEYKDNKWRATVGAQKIEAAGVLNDALERARLGGTTIQRDCNTNRGWNMKKQGRSWKKALADNRRLSRELGGLRDPGRRASCPDPVPTGSSTTSDVAGSPADSRLSDEASSFLLEFAADADRAARYALSCYNWVRLVSGQKP